MPAVTPQIGVNLESVVDWSTAWNFTDAFKNSRPWISHAYNTATGQSSWEGGGVVHVDAKGWPTQLNQTTNSQNQVIQQQLGTLMFRDIGTNYPAGTYRAEWKGTGDVSFGFAARVTQQGTLADGTRYALLNVTPDPAGIYLKIASMGAADPIRDIHVWMPDASGQTFPGQVWKPGATFSPFHPRLLERLAPFETIRFMDWQETNGSDTVTWADKRPYDYATQQSGDYRNGVAPEYMVELCNELDANAWICMPHQADDTYVRNLATYFRDNLEPGRKVFIEWSNEVWNGGYGFEAFPWVTARLSLPENAYLNGDRWAFVARETKRDFDIWSEVFAGQTSRMVRVVAGQQANSWIAGQILANMGGHFDAVSASAYIHLDDAARAKFSTTTTSDQVIDTLLQAIPTAVGWLKDHKALATQYSTSLGRPIGFVAYEGGPHLDGRGASYQPAFFAAATNPRMREVYAQLLQGSQSAGLDEFLQFSLTGGYHDSSFGSFGALQYMEQPASAAPKYQALLDAASGTLYQPAVSTVSIASVSANASETGPTAATFRLVRTGNVSSSITIPLELGGKAVATDYTGVPQSVTFAVGESVKNLSLVPLDDALVEGAEQAVISLAVGTGFVLDPAKQSITVTIQDNDTQAGTGLLGQYFDLANLAKPTLTRNDRSINFAWGAASPATGIQADRFSVRWTGWIQAVETGTYYFRTYSDDGVRLAINGATVIDNFTTHLATYNNSAGIYLRAGQRVPIRLDYFDNSGTAQIRLEWRRPSQSYFIGVPSSQLATQNSTAYLGQGLLGQYFDMATQSVANVTRLDTVMAFNWTGNAPAPSMSRGPFVARWTGYIQGMEAGGYQFRVTANDGYRLWINGVLALNRPDNRVASSSNTPTITIPAGQRVQVKLEFYGYTNRSQVALNWRRPGALSFSTIPTSQMFT